MTTLLTGAQVAAATMDTPSNAPLESQASRTGPPTTDTKQSHSPLAAGRWLLSGYGSAAVGTGDRVYAGHVGLGYYFIDNISLNLEGVGYFIEHANTTGGGLALVPRWHYLKRDHWSLYLDGGMGFIYTRDPLRDPGTRFNLRSRAAQERPTM
jgi:lipid A 3-O-deacylase